MRAPASHAHGYYVIAYLVNFFFSPQDRFALHLAAAASPEFHQALRSLNGDDAGHGDDDGGGDDQENNSSLEAVSLISPVSI